MWENLRYLVGGLGVILSQGITLGSEGRPIVPRIECTS